MSVNVTFKNVRFSLKGSKMLKKTKQEEKMVQANILGDKIEIENPTVADSVKFHTIKFK